MGSTIVPISITMSLHRDAPQLYWGSGIAAATTYQPKPCTANPKPLPPKPRTRCVGGVAPHFAVGWDDSQWFTKASLCRCAGVFAPCTAPSKQKTPKEAPKTTVHLRRCLHEVPCRRAVARAEKKSCGRQHSLTLLILHTLHPETRALELLNP